MSEKSALKCDFFSQNFFAEKVSSFLQEGNFPTFFGLLLLLPLLFVFKWRERKRIKWDENYDKFYGCFSARGKKIFSARPQDHRLKKDAASKERDQQELEVTPMICGSKGK